MKFIRKYIPNSLVNYCKHLPMGIMANLYYGFPSKELIVIGVTGTDGKTTTSMMLFHILKSAGLKAAIISTVSARIGDQDIDTGFHVTSPDHFPLQKLLRRIVNQGYRYVVLEATSQGLDQHRLWGVHFRCGIVTNISEDHLDYHKTWENYALAKAMLFQNTSFAVLNKEDKSYNFLKTRVNGKVITYGLKSGDWNLKNFKIKLKTFGSFNVLNALGASAVAGEIGIAKDKIQAALTTFSGVKGRQEIIQKKPFLIMVDFAHTPNGLKVILEELRKNLPKNNKLIAVYGSAGERDRNRRKMGLISGKLADITIITAEDPRFEGVEAISNEIARWAFKAGAKGIKSNLLTKQNINGRIYTKVPDRYQAIKLAVKLAKKGDIIGIFGKGHERSMCYENHEIPWSDQETVKKILSYDK